MIKQRKRYTTSATTALLTVAMLTTLPACTVSYEPELRTELMNRACVALWTKKLNCEQQNLAFDDAQPHSEFEQQMLPIHRREEVLRSVIDDL